jgi:hypothetical protein
VINANVLNNAEVDGGRHNFPSVLTVVGDYTQTSAGVLVIEIEIAGPGVHTDSDQRAITGRATLDGTLTVRLLTAILPPSDESVVILTFGSGSGVFATINGDGGPLFTPSFDPTDVTLVAKRACFDRRGGGAQPPRRFLGAIAVNYRTNPLFHVS